MRKLLLFLVALMYQQAIILPNGITAGSPFALNHLVMVSATTPTPQLSSINPVMVTDSGSGVLYLSVPDSTNAGVPTNQNATETIRINGGLIVQGPGTDSVAIGRGAAASIPSGANGADVIAIGRGTIGGTVSAHRVAIGALANYSGGASVVVGYNSGSGSANPVGGVFIGDAAQASGNGGGATVVVIGDGALITLGNAGGGGGIAIGASSSASHPAAVVVGRAAQASMSSNLSQNTVTIGDSATSTRAGTTVIGGAASTIHATSVVIGSGASDTQNSAVSTGSIVIGQTATTSAAGTIVIGTASTSTNAQEIIIGHGNASLSTQVMQLGGPNSAILTFVLGEGNTKATPSARTIRFTNGSGSDNAAGDVTIQAALSTGAATPGRLNFSVGVAGGSSSTIQTPTTMLQLDASTTAADIRMLVYDVTAAALVRVSRGAVDSGGVGFRVLRVPN